MWPGEKTLPSRQARRRRRKCVQKAVLKAALWRGGALPGYSVKWSIMCRQLGGRTWRSGSASTGSAQTFWWRWSGGTRSRCVFSLRLLVFTGYLLAACPCSSPSPRLSVSSPACPASWSRPPSPHPWLTLQQSSIMPVRAGRASSELASSPCDPRPSRCSTGRGWPLHPQPLHHRLLLLHLLLFVSLHPTLSPIPPPPPFRHPSLFHPPRQFRAFDSSAPHSFSLRTFRAGSARLAVTRVNVHRLPSSLFCLHLYLDLLPSYLLPPPPRPPNLPSHHHPRLPCPSASFHLPLTLRLFPPPGTSGHAPITHQIHWHRRGAWGRLLRQRPYLLPPRAHIDFRRLRPAARSRFVVARRWRARRW